MGARPLVVMDPLFFGNLTDARQRWLVEGVVSGISGYGNSVGVPTIGGELTFDDCYASNPLVNVLCAGALPVERLVLGRASGVGNLAVLLGSATGRDGIGGVSVLASAGFSGEDGAASLDDAKRPSVQVGDPYEEKRLIEACLALLDGGYVVGIQDLGGAGLVCATSETAARGGVGMDVDVTAVPQREPNMQPYEIMTSESQERMLAIIEPSSWDSVKALCDQWEVRATVVGRVTEPPLDADGKPYGLLRIRNGFDGEILAEVPASSLADDAPLYDRPRQRPANLDAIIADDPTSSVPAEITNDVLDMLIDPSWVYRQYDSQLFLNTVVGPGRDGALLRLAGPGLPASNRGLALTTDSNPRWCALDPRAGTAWTLAEAVANVACVGATPVAVVNCLNFGNPEHPEVMWQLSETVDGLAEGCNALNLPVIGGNVSLYNESGGNDIDPTPVLGVLALVESLTTPPPGWTWSEGETVIVVGNAPIEPSLAGSRWATTKGRRGGRLPAFDAALLGETAAFIAKEVSWILAGNPSDLTAVHDIASGGLVGALAEIASVAGVGLVSNVVTNPADLLVETPGRFVVATSNPTAFLERAAQSGITTSVLGVAGGSDLKLDSAFSAHVATIAERRSGALDQSLRAAG